MKIMKNLFTKVILMFLTLNMGSVYAQVGIGTTAPSGALDITSTTNGMVIPRVTLTSLTIAAPVVNPQGGVLTAGTLVYNVAVSPVAGFYYWDSAKWVSLTGDNSKDWSTTGNSGTIGGNITTAGSNYIGTNDVQNIDFRTAGVFRGRFSSLGEFFVGTLNTALLGDLSNAVGNTTFPWALNGYTSFAAGGTYGLRQAGSTGTWGGVQGELDTTVPAGSSGVRGSVGATSQYGVSGYKPSGGSGYGGVFFNDLGYSGGFYTVSDRRLKKNIQPLHDVLGMLKSIPFYSYNFKTDEYDVLGGNETHYGVMSDELMTVIPSLVKSKSFIAGNIRSLPDDKQPKSIPFEVNAVNYIELIPIAIEGIKEQQKIIENQNLRIEKLEKIILELQKKK
jgi:Chaperone of endosialidase